MGFEDRNPHFVHNYLVGIFTFVFCSTDTNYSAEWMISITAEGLSYRLIVPYSL
jgi:hypothetical protein